jgi:hypothetical protein
MKKEQKARADIFVRSTLLSKAMNTLSVHKMCKQNQMTLVKDVEKIRRKVIFVSWFNHVHNDLPTTRKAADFYLRSKFNALRDLAVHNRSLRTKRDLLSQLSAEYYPYMLKKRGVLKWKRVSDRNIDVN